MKWFYMTLRLFFCPHKWQRFKQVDIFEENDRSMPIGRKYVCSCTRCGKHKTFRS